MERTARRFLDSMARDKTLKSLAMSEGQHKGLAPMHLLSIGERFWLPHFISITPRFHLGSPVRDNASNIYNAAPAGSVVTEVVGDCGGYSLDLHFIRACAKCNLESAAACALGRIICILCSISSLSLIHPPCTLASAAAATAMLRCGVVFVPSEQKTLHSAPQLLAIPSTAPHPFDFVWKGCLSAEGVAQEGARRVGHGFQAMMRALEWDGHSALHAALLDVQVCYASG